MNYKKCRAGDPPAELCSKVLRASRPRAKWSTPASTRRAGRPHHFDYLASCNLGTIPIYRARKNGRNELRPYNYERGYTLAGVLVLIGIMSIMMAMALPVWDRIKQRENEEELIFRGKEYAEAIGRYHTKFNSFPPDVETLLKMKYIRKLYKDPMTEKGVWKLLHPDSLVETGEAGFINQPGTKKRAGDDEDEENDQQVIPGSGGGTKEDSKEDLSEQGDEKSIGPVVGVVSRSKKTSLRIYNGQSTYDKWIFAYVPQQQVQPPPTQPQKPGTKPNKDKGGKKPPPPPKKPPG